MTHLEKAKELLYQGYHCSQALFGAFAGEFGLDERTAFKLSTCYGAGMRRGETCGVISAGLLVLGLAFGFYDVDDRELEMYGNQKTREYIDRFEEKMGSIRCRDILKHNFATEEGTAAIRQAGLVVKRCPDVMETGIALLEEMLKGSEEIRAVGQYRDETSEVWRGSDKKEDDRELRRMMKQTGKRRHFRQNVTRLIGGTREQIAFIQFDIRGFKIINDLYGEHFGDEVLYNISKQLQELCGEEQYFINLQSDVFMVVTAYEARRDLEQFIDLLDDRLSMFRDLELHFSFGVYTVIDRGMELRQMEGRASMARKAAKESVLTNVVYYTEQFKELLYTRKFIEESMKAAINGHQFKMYLQPKYSIRQNRIVGAEALVRWVHPQRGMIFPDEFIPIIEENGFIRNVDYFIWEEAARFIGRLLKEGIADCPISVNMSRIHLQDDLCKEVLERILKETGIDRQLLELEITETVDDQQISKKAQELKDRGFKLLMDDFGSGYSSLNILLETPFDVIKLDRKFVGNMMLSERGKVILEHVAAMADKIGLGLLAEGVETKEQAQVLQGLGCDLAQGYFYAKPMPAEEFYERLVRERKGETGQGPQR